MSGAKTFRMRIEAHIRWHWLVYWFSIFGVHAYNPFMRFRSIAYSYTITIHMRHRYQNISLSSLSTQYVSIHRFYLAGSTSLPVRFLIQVSVNIASAFIKILSLMWCISLGLPTTWFCRLVSSVLSMTGDLRVISLEGNEKNSRSFNVFLLCSHHVGWSQCLYLCQLPTFLGAVLTRETHGIELN